MGYLKTHSSLCIRFTGQTFGRCQFVSHVKSFYPWNSFKWFLPTLQPRHFLVRWFICRNGGLLLVASTVSIYPWQLSACNKLACNLPYTLNAICKFIYSSQVKKPIISLWQMMWWKKYRPIYLHLKIKGRPSDFPLHNFRWEQTKTILRSYRRSHSHLSGMMLIVTLVQHLQKIWKCSKVHLSSLLL